MAGSVTTTVVRNERDNFVLKYVCTGDAADGGSVPNQTIYGREDFYLYAMKTIPGAGGDAPSAVYDVTVLDALSVDLLVGTGADRSVTLPETCNPAGAPASVEGTLTLTCNPLGNSNKTTIVLVFRR